MPHNTGMGRSVTLHRDGEECQVTPGWGRRVSNSTGIWRSVKFHRDGEETDHTQRRLQSCLDALVKILLLEKDLSKFVPYTVVRILPVRHVSFIIKYLLTRNGQCRNSSVGRALD